MRPIRRQVLFAFLTAVLVVGVIEAGSQLLWRFTMTTDIRDHVDLLGGAQSRTALMAPNAFWHHDLNRAHPLYATALNQYNTLGPDFEMPKPAGELRVLCLGDSTTEGSGVRWDEAYPARLEEDLQEVLESTPRYTSARVINAGVSSHNSAFSLAYLALRLIHFAPDVIVIKSGYNDFLPYIRTGLGFDYRNVFPRPFALNTSREPYWVAARYSATLRLLGVALYPDQVSNPYDDYSGEITLQEIEQLDWEQNEGRFFLYAENLRSMVLLAKGRGMTPLLLDLPTSPDDNHFFRGIGPRYRGLVERLEREVERVADEEEVRHVRTAPLVASDFLDHIHGTAAGNRKIAQRVAAAIEAWLGASGDADAAPPPPGVQPE